MPFANRSMRLNTSTSSSAYSSSTTSPIPSGPRCGQLKEELQKERITGPHAASLLEKNRDEYTAERVFWVPLDGQNYRAHKRLLPNGYLRDELPRLDPGLMDGTARFLQNTRSNRTAFQIAVC